MGYFESVTADVKDWIKNNLDEIKEKEFSSIEDLAEWLDNKLWNNDDVTGKSTQYFELDELAKEAVFNNSEEVAEALEELCVDASTIADKFLHQDWHYFDVTTRCFMLYGAIMRVIENEDELMDEILP